MTNKKLRTTLFGLATLILTSCISTAQQTGHTVKVVGAMKNVIWNGQLSGTINLDTIAEKQHLFGLGPLEYLAGELTIIDGRSYKSTVLTDSTMTVEETYEAKAPFFVYANIAQWRAQALPDSVQTISQLENYLDQITRTAKRPFAFRLSGVVETGTIHVVNLPKGSKVSSPGEAHQGRKKFHFQNVQSEIVGFFSTEHQAIFTHHHTFLHMHLITADRQKMGHLDEVLFKKGTMTVYLP